MILQESIEISQYSLNPARWAWAANIQIKFQDVTGLAVDQVKDKDKDYGYDAQRDKKPFFLFMITYLPLETVFGYSHMRCVFVRAKIQIEVGLRKPMTTFAYDVFRYGVV
jgi:ABC-type microcin C transport system permease subunit YejB